MERYHIFKLGLAILFYAAYCARPTLVYSLEADNELQHRDQPNSQSLDEFYGYYQGLDGKPGIDFPVYSYIPRTSFNCRGVESGYYADLETDCQVFHICENSKKISFLCPNGTVFQQAELICEWWNKVNCSNSPNLYESSAERLQNDIAKRKLSRRVQLSNGNINHGAIMRMEESSSVTAKKNGKVYPIKQEAQNRRNHQNRRIPENNDIELNIAVEESNNRHLAQANSVQQNNRHPNHNYNTQVRKDINKKTGNSLNDDTEKTNSFKAIDRKPQNKKDYEFGPTQNPSPSTREQKSYQSSLNSNSVPPIYKQHNSGFSSDKHTAYLNNGNQNLGELSGNNLQPQFNQKTTNQFNQKATRAQNYHNENESYQQTQTTPKFGNSNPTTQVFGQKTTFNKNYVSATTQNYRQYKNTQFDDSRNPTTQRYTTQYNAQPLTNQNYEPTTQNYRTTQYDIYHKTYSDSTTRPTTKNSQNGVQNIPVYIGSILASENQSQRTSTLRAPDQNNNTNYIKTQNENIENSAKNNRKQNGFAQTPAQLGNTFSQKTQPDDVFLPPQLKEIITVPPKQAESISTAPQIAQSVYVPPRFAQGLSVPPQNAQSVTSYIQTAPTVSSTIRSQNNQNRKSNHNSRGNTRFNPNDFDDGQPKNHYEKNNMNKQSDKQNTDQLGPKRNVQKNEVYELEFPKHKSEKKSSQPNDLEESQITQESASFVQTPFNSINNNYKTSLSPYPNHRSTYSDIKPQVTFEAPKMTSISSITPHLVTTQPINNGKPFVGSKVGSTLLPSKGSSSNGPTYLPTTSTTSIPTTHKIIFGVLRHSSTTESPYGPPELFNLGQKDKTLPPIEFKTTVTNSIPTDIFNIGKTDITLRPNVVPTYHTTTLEPLKIYVPDEGSLNTYDNQSNTIIPKEVFEPPFTKKFVPLLYSSTQPYHSTPKTFDHAIVYGTFTPSTNQFSSSTTSKPNNDAEIVSVQNSNNVNQAVPVKFNKVQDKVTVHLSKALGSQNSLERNSGSQNLNEYVRISAGQSIKSTATPYKNGFSVTKAPNPVSTTSRMLKSQTQKPRPFAKSLDLPSQNNANGQKDANPNFAAFPFYSLSSARPFQKVEPTEATFTSRSFPYDNVDNMLNVLKEIAGANSKSRESNRTGLVIPPSVSPQTLHSLAQYFANELDTDSGILNPDTKEEFTGLLTQMTVHGYNTLFRQRPSTQEKIFNSTTDTTLSAPTTTENPTFSTVTSTLGINTDLSTTTIATDLRHGESDYNEQNNEIQIDDNTQEPPIELRQLARNFSLALSSYLKNPENFKKELESLRPTEPPPLESEEGESSNSESGDEELLNFSDADLKSSTPFFYPSSPSPPSPTWGYILAGAPKGNDNGYSLNNRDNFYQNTAKTYTLSDDVNNSLNRDLNTEDSQSIHPGYNNNFAVKEDKKGRTELPEENHWTSNPDATKLWQKTLSVNPLSVNDNLITTPLPLTSAETESSIEELYNYEDIQTKVDEPSSEISYELKSLPPLNINSTQIHGILLDFMNHTKSDDQNRLQRILKKLNTSEDEFLTRMREIESNPLTKRLILLLISECGANITQTLDSNAQQNPNIQDVELLDAAQTGVSVSPRSVDVDQSLNRSLINLVDPKLKADDEDARALQLLNALYSIASRFGK